MVSETVMICLFFFLFKMLSKNNCKTVHMQCTSVAQAVVLVRICTRIQAAGIETLTKNVPLSC